MDLAVHWALFPGLAIFLTVLTINFIGDGCATRSTRDACSDMALLDIRAQDPLQDRRRLAACGRRRRPAIDAGETVCVVGESGCGKSVTAKTVMKLIDMPPGKIVAGQVLWQGRDLVPLSAEEMQKIRAKEIAIIFQEPMTSLNPVYTVGEQIAESVRLHEGL
jgi:ABC-type antimicrobial peptide transport system ATPase subunit